VSQTFAIRQSAFSQLNSRFHRGVYLFLHRFIAGPTNCHNSRRQATGSTSEACKAFGVKGVEVFPSGLTGKTPVEESRERTV